VVSRFMAGLSRMKFTPGCASHTGTPPLPLVLGQIFNLHSSDPVFVYVSQIAHIYPSSWLGPLGHCFGDPGKKCLLSIVELISHLITSWAFELYQSH
jgi:hypothetical protein